MFERSFLVLVVDCCVECAGFAWVFEDVLLTVVLLFSRRARRRSRMVLGPG